MVTCGGMLIVFVSSCGRSYAHFCAADLLLDPLHSVNSSTLPLKLHDSVRFLCPVLGPRVRVFVRGASVSFNTGLATWLDLDTYGDPRLDLRLTRWFVGNPWSTFSVAVVARTLLDASGRL